MAISQAGLNFAAGRKLDQQTLELLGVASGTAFFRDLNRKSEAVFFKYAEGWKARSVEEKAFTAGGGFKTSFWNLERVLTGKLDRVYVTEGELDACALVQAGVPADAVLSVPNGASMRKADEGQELRGFEYVTEALQAGLLKVKRFVWCGDADEVGLALRSDMARVLGQARFEFLEWPEGIKDAGEMLQKDGAEDLLDLVVNGTLPWPINGIYRLSDLPEPPKMVLWSPGFLEWERKIMLAPRTLSVVTGHPGHGKTQLWTQIWYQVCNSYQTPIAIASFESLPKPHIRRYLRSLHQGKLEKECSPEEIAKADKFINERYVFMMHPENRPSLKWFLEMAEAAVIRFGARVIQLDPWNRLESDRQNREHESEYIGRCLRELHTFAKDMNCHVQILAHPAKMGDRKKEPPELEDIAGSKNWDNMVDQGFAVHRPKMFEKGNRLTEAILIHRKSRFEELGYPCSLNMRFVVSEGRYKSADYEEA